MKTIKTVIFSIMLLVASAMSASAQKNDFKVEEASAKRMPEWVNAVEQDYLNVTATAGDIEAAKAAVIENVKNA